MQTVSAEDRQAAMDFFYQCRLHATSKQTGWRFLRTMVFTLRPIICHEVGTWGVDKGWRLYIAPNWTKKLSVAQGVAVLRHEIMHLLLKHCSRSEMIHKAFGTRPETHHTLLNDAMDMVINQIPDIEKYIKDPVLQGIHHSLYKGFEPNLTVEEYYHKLLQLPRNEDGKEGTVMRGNCGSGADGMSRPWELPPNDADSPSVSEAMATTTSINAARELTTSQVMGKMPGGIVRAIEEMLYAEVDWRTELRACIRARLEAVLGNGSGQLNPRRPHRRSHLRKPFIRPSLRSVKAKVGLFIDTSGSMGSHDGDSPLAQAAAEAYAILREVEGPTVVLAVDAAISSKKEMRHGQKIDVSGGGGTDMRLGYQGLAEADLDLGIGLTDGYTPWPDKSPDFPCITVLVGEDVGEAPKILDTYPHKVLYSVPKYKRGKKKK